MLTSESKNQTKKLSILISNGKATAKEESILAPQTKPTETYFTELVGIYKWDKYQKYRQNTIVLYGKALYLLTAESPEFKEVETKENTYKKIALQDQSHSSCGCSGIVRLLDEAKYTKIDKRDTYKDPTDGTAWEILAESKKKTEENEPKFIDAFGDEL